MTTSSSEARQRRLDGDDLAAAANNITTTTTTSANSICTYVIVVKTGSMQAAGTDARISVKFQAPVGRGALDIPDLESWTRNNADPFERGSVDIFYGGNATCFDACRMRLESDGTGPYPGWYVESVFIQAIADSWMDEYSNLLEVNQWLAVDEPPYQLFAERDVCNPTRTGTGSGAGAAVMQWTAGRR